MVIGWTLLKKRGGVNDIRRTVLQSGKLVFVHCDQKLSRNVGRVRLELLCSLDGEGCYDSSEQRDLCML